MGVGVEDGVINVYIVFLPCQIFHIIFSTVVKINCQLIKKILLNTLVSTDY